MRFFLLAGAVVIFPAATQAQITITDKVPMEWQVPSGCRSDIKYGDGEWEESVCNMVEVSTHGDSHNIRFLLGDASVTYITSRSSSSVVHAVGFKGPRGTMVARADGKCLITSKRIYQCTALVEGGSVKVIHSSTFLNDTYPALDQILLAR